MNLPMRVSDRNARFERDAMPYMTRLYPTALRLTGNHSDAEDLLQDTFAKAYVAFHQFRPGTNLRAWLHKVMASTFMNMCRARKRQPLQAGSTDFQEGWQASAETLHAPVRSAEAEALDLAGDSAVLQALADLPKNIREVIYLAAIEGYAYHEIAEIMGTPLGTVMSRAYRGRAKLRAKLAHYAPPRHTLRCADRAASPRPPGTRNHANGAIECPGQPDARTDPIRMTVPSGPPARRQLPAGVA